jgi:starvation-inducible DNA-binding protein
VAEALGTTATHVCKAIGEAAEIGDAATEDVFTEIVRELDEKLWFVEAHLQGKR